MKPIYTFIASCILSTTAFTQPPVDTASDEHTLQIGLAAVSSESIYVGGQSQSRAFPAIDYQYKKFYFQAGDLGVKLIDTNDWEMNLGLGVNLAGDTDRGESPLFNQLPELSVPLNAFISTQYKTPLGSIKLTYELEVNNKHDGHSASIDYSTPLRLGQWMIIPKVGIEHHSRDVVNYFYGVAQTGSSPALPAYQSGSVQNWHIGITGLRTLNKKWSFLGSVRNEFYGDAITDSPLVDDDQRLSIFAGVLYQFF